jgi:hypothetical protein
VIVPSAIIESISGISVDPVRASTEEGSSVLTSGSKCISCAVSSDEDCLNEESDGALEDRDTSSEGERGGGEFRVTIVDGLDVGRKEERKADAKRDSGSWLVLAGDMAMVPFGGIVGAAIVDVEASSASSVSTDSEVDSGTGSPSPLEGRSNRYALRPRSTTYTPARYISS